MTARWNRTFNAALVALLVIQWAGCGTVLYPERRGQKAGHLDAGVVILDGIGLLFFLIPGIIAYAVDFSNGTIYLPSSPLRGVRNIKFDPRATTLADVENIIKKETGQDVALAREQVKITRLKSTDDLMAHFNDAESGMQNDRIALSR